MVLWSTMVGLIRGVSEGLGPVGGAAMIYSLSGLLLIFTVGLPIFSFQQPMPPGIKPPQHCASPGKPGLLLILRQNPRPGTALTR
ncbi:hypothetical protein MJI37_31685, partial [Salmonella enterica subsp. enterica serovar Cerro]|nr:hypothetical protein [Salmonella enterica subsp. enterica serovar Cerro]